MSLITTSSFTGTTPSTRTAFRTIGLLQIILSLLSFSSTSLAADAAAWRGRSIYQAFTDRFARPDGSTTAACDVTAEEYCGGTWQGLINQLDYITGMGFTAVWISPITKPIPIPGAYHGYWQQNLYELNTAFGNASDLVDLANALHARDMLLMVDIVVNHNGNVGYPNATNYTQFTPFDDESYYHNYCNITNWNNQSMIEECWLGDDVISMPDLRTEDSTVQAEYQTWISELVSNYSIDGLRIDTVKHVDLSFWEPFVQSAGVFCTGEVLDGNSSYVAPFQDLLPSVLGYPNYYNAVSAMSANNGSMYALYDQLNSVKSLFTDSTVLGSFSENADNPRFASLTEDMALAKNVLTFTFLTDGIPIVYYGQEQHATGTADPYNRGALWLEGYNTDSTLYRHIASLNQIRNTANYLDANYLTYRSFPSYVDDHTMVIRKGWAGLQTVAVLSNLGEEGVSYELDLTVLQTGFGLVQNVMEVVGCTQQTTDALGTLHVQMSEGLPMVFYPQAKLIGTGVCGL